MTIPEQAEKLVDDLIQAARDHEKAQSYETKYTAPELEAERKKVIAALVGVQRPEDVAEIVRSNLTAFFGGAPSHVVEAMTHDILALPHTGQPQEGGGNLIVPTNPCLKKLCVDEPFFVLLGRDEQAPMAVERWADYRAAAEGKSEWTEQAREVANSMRAYRIARKAGLASTLPAAAPASPREVHERETPDVPPIGQERS